MANETKALQVMTDAGELAEINLDNWSGPTDVELGKLRKLSELEGSPIAIIGIDWTQGKRPGIEDKECALIAYLDGETAGGRPMVKGCYSFSEDVVKSLHNFEAVGKGSLAAPVAVKVIKAGPTSNGFYVFKLDTLTADEDSRLKKALAA